MQIWQLKMFSMGKNGIYKQKFKIKHFFAQK